jgi:hypothetical protein
MVVGALAAASASICAFFWLAAGPTQNA